MLIYKMNYIKDNLETVELEELKMKSGIGDIEIKNKREINIVI